MGARPNFLQSDSSASGLPTRRGFLLGAAGVLASQAADAYLIRGFGADPAAAEGVSGSAAVESSAHPSRSASAPDSPIVPRVRTFGEVDQDVRPAVTWSGDSVIADAFWRAPREIWMSRPASGEKVRIIFWRDGQIIDSAYEELCYFLRDLRIKAIDRTASSVKAMNPRLLDILYAYSAWLKYLGISRPLVLSSAYRHPLTNASLEGAALASRHTTGDAADVILPGISSELGGAFGRWLSGGGVGVYPLKGHVHVDSGPVRHWTDYGRKPRPGK